jgi:hypothetical protein
LDETHPTQGRRSSTTPGYEEWEFCVFTGTFLVGALWSIQLGIKLTHLGLQLGWSITVASFVGVIGLFTGPGYFTVGVIYGGIWPAFFREKGKSAEEAEYEEVE